MGNLNTRIQKLEMQKGSISAIPEQERCVVLCYPADLPQEKIDGLWTDKMVELREKYGPNVKESDFFVVSVKQFYRAKEGCNHEYQSTD